MLCETGGVSFCLTPKTRRNPDGHMHVDVLFSKVKETKIMTRDYMLLLGPIVYAG